MTTLTITTRLVGVDCPQCGIHVGFPEDFLKRRRDDGRLCYCPNGHTFGWFDTKEKRLQRDLDRQKANYEWANDQRKAAQAEADLQRQRAAGYKGQMRKVQKRAANGVCPCCNRTFVNVERHMKGQHPDFVEAHGG